MPTGRFPYMCSLRKRGSREHVCGAALFRRDWILTAAHCVDSRIEEATGLSPLVYCGIHKLDEIDPDKASDGRDPFFGDAVSSRSFRYSMYSRDTSTKIGQSTWETETTSPC